MGISIELKRSFESLMKVHKLRVEDMHRVLRERPGFTVDLRTLYRWMRGQDTRRAWQALDLLKRYYKVDQEDRPKITDPITAIQALHGINARFDEVQKHAADLEKNIAGLRDAINDVSSRFAAVVDYLKKN